MKDALKKLEEFHRKIYKERVSVVAGEPKSIVLLRLRLMMSELGELADAMAEDDLVLIADGLADLLYVTIGTALVYNLPIDEIFDEVHKSNLTKQMKGLAPGEKGSGKTDGFKPPDIRGILKRHGLL